MIAALDARHVFALQAERWDDGLWHATLETQDQHEAPEQNIAEMVAAVESLNDDDRRLWLGCSRREFNIGCECGTAPRTLDWAISSGLLARIASIHASLAFTLYASSP